MFSYIDPKVRQHLVERGQLLRIDQRGQVVPHDADLPDDEMSLNVLGPIPLPIDVAGQPVTFQWWAFVRHTELTKAEEIAKVIRQRGDKRLWPLLNSHMAVNSALVYGDLKAAERPLVRIHSNCLTGDVFGSKRCECGPQLKLALERIVADDQKAGVLVYMAGHEGRGIGLWAKAITYLLQDDGQDTYQANRSLGLPDDSRDFSDAAAVLLYMLGGNEPFRFMSNNPKKQRDLEAMGVTNFESVRHVTGVNPFNRRYLSAKRGWGHDLPEDIAEPKAQPKAETKAQPKADTKD
ncbi:MAG: GTP cyclohydrolase II [Myxococcales bacterium]|nr:GTP cyclohydrolase II [Myxococcales bacterium]